MGDRHRERSYLQAPRTAQIRCTCTRVAQRAAHASSKQQASPRGRIPDEIQPGRMQSPGEVLISRRPCAGVRPRARKLARLVGGGGPHELAQHPRSSGHLAT